MVTTEKDAKFRFCPLLTTSDGKLRFCQGSQCMMWRWSGDAVGDTANGFCGLACAPVGVRASQGSRSAPSGKTENPFG